MSAENCLFCRIGRGEIPSKKVFEDDNASWHSMTSIRPPRCTF